MRGRKSGTIAKKTKKRNKEDDVEDAQSWATALHCSFKRTRLALEHRQASVDSDPFSRTVVWYVCPCCELSKKIKTIEKRKKELPMCRSAVAAKLVAMNWARSIKRAVGRSETAFLASFLHHFTTVFYIVFSLPPPPCLSRIVKIGCCKGKNDVLSRKRSRKREQGERERVFRSSLRSWSAKCKNLTSNG